MNLIVNDQILKFTIYLPSYLTAFSRDDFYCFAKLHDALENDITLMKSYNPLLIPRYIY